MDDNQFWALVWKILGACFTVVVITLGGCVVNTNTLLGGSNDPIALACAMGNTERAQTCEVVRARK